MIKKIIYSHTSMTFWNLNFHIETYETDCHTSMTIFLPFPLIFSIVRAHRVNILMKRINSTPISLVHCKILNSYLSNLHHKSVAMCLGH